MSMIKCPECHKKISSEAKVCVHCGCPISELPSSAFASKGDCSNGIKTSKKVFLITLGILLSIVGGIIAYRQVTISVFKAEITSDLYKYEYFPELSSYFEYSNSYVINNIYVCTPSDYTHYVVTITFYDTRVPIKYAFSDLVYDEEGSLISITTEADKETIQHISSNSFYKRIL